MKFLYKNKYWKIDKEYHIDKILYLLSDKPYEITILGGYVWKNEKYQWHRDYDLPAVVYANSVLFWYKNDHSYRDNNKPARIWFDGEKNFIKQYENIM